MPRSLVSRPFTHILDHITQSLKDVPWFGSNCDWISGQLGLVVIVRKNDGFPSPRAMARESATTKRLFSGLATTLKPSAGLTTLLHSSIY